MSELKYFDFILDEPSTNDTECSRKVANGRKVAGAIRSVINAKDLQLERVRVLHEKLLVAVLI